MSFWPNSPFCFSKTLLGVGSGSNYIMTTPIVLGGVKVFIDKRWVVTCDTKEVVLDDHMGKDPIGLNILYCPNDIFIIITIWNWWPLCQQILDEIP